MEDNDKHKPKVTRKAAAMIIPYLYTVNAPYHTYLCSDLLAYITGVKVNVEFLLNTRKFAY